jgi:hypothetical protein
VRKKNVVEIVWALKDRKEQEDGVTDKMKSFLICEFHRTSLETSSDG